MERAAVEELLCRAAEADLIDHAKADAGTAGWIMALVGAMYLQAATRDRFDAATQLPILRLTVEHLLRPD